MSDSYADKQKEKIRESSTKEVAPFLIEDEVIEDLYPLTEDFIIFTNYRAIFVDKQFTSSKKAISSVFYEKITSISLSKGGFLKLSKDFQIGVGSKGFEFRLYDENHVAEIYRFLSRKLAGKKIPNTI